MPGPPPDLERLYDDHAQALYAFLLNLSRHESDTRDLLQTLFCRLAAKPALLDGVRNERAFLHRLAFNLFVDSRRAAKRAEPPSTLLAPAEDPDERAFREALETALRELPEDQRTVAHLKLWSGLTFAEIAATLAISPNTAASRYRYAIDKLRTLLRPIYDEIQ